MVATADPAGLHPGRAQSRVTPRVTPRIQSRVQLSHQTTYPDIIMKTHSLETIRFSYTLLEADEL